MATNEDSKKTPIYCVNCRKESGYFIEDFAYKKVEFPQCCKVCKHKILDKPDFPVPLYN